MSVTVTIHSGELKQIKRLIKSEKKKNSENGQLYGLWTHSNQPVIQYVIGDPKGGGDVAKYLWENHGLRHVGNWSTKEPKGKGNRSNIFRLHGISHTLPRFIMCAHISFICIDQHYGQFCVGF